MVTLENQPKTEQETEDAEKLSVEKSATKGMEAGISSEQVEEAVREHSSEIQATGEKTVSEGQESFAEAVNIGSNLGLKTEDINQVSVKMSVVENLEAKQKEIDKVTAEAKEKIGKLAEAPSESPEDGREKKETEKTLEEKEQDYIAKKMGSSNEDAKDFVGLDKRHQDERSGAEHIQKQIAEYISASGLKRESAPELENQTFNPETKKVIQDRIKSDLEALLLNKENARHNPEKFEAMAMQSERFLNLMEQAQGEGDISSEISAAEILKLVERNIDMITFQDRVASENMLGDHGIRHVVGFNIKMTEQMLDSIAEKGQEVKAIDRIMGHQIMLMHDLGYATDPVRDGVNKGEFTADKGHNLLSAKILRQMSENPDDALAKIFSKEQLDILHEGVLEHDDSRVEFHVNDGDPTSRKENLLSAIHMADNTHAFEDKLPELLYSVPESLKAMRLLKTAGEIGDKDMIESVKKQLIADIGNNENYSEDDKEALTKAVGGLNDNSYKFAVGRICGNKPEVSIGDDGRVSIRVQESAIHQEAVGLFGQQSYDQLKKFIGDLEGKKKKDITDEMLNQETFVGKNVTIKLELGDNKSKEKTDYQKRIESIITDEKFVEFSNSDLEISRAQKILEGKVEEILKIGPPTEENSVMLNKMQENISRYKSQRKEIYNNYAKNGEK